MNDANLKFILGLEPKKAIEFLVSKKKIAEKLNDKYVMNSVRAKATSIANLTCLTMTNDIYQSLLDSQKQGLSFNSWKKNIFENFKRKGWIAGYDKDYLIVDPMTGEFFGTPKRLETIYRTNMQGAYSAQRYQQMRDNADNRPYWQYDAVNDNKTRPSHLAMDGVVYKYDDPFWDTFYPPNGFNCRCSVIAFSARDVKRLGLIVKDGSQHLIKNIERQTKNGIEFTIGFKNIEGKIICADKGFDYNVGKTSYLPNLNLYPESLAHEFACKEMKSESFKIAFSQFKEKFDNAKELLGFINKKLDKEEIKVIGEHLRMEYQFIAGILTFKNKLFLNSNTVTVMLSDSTLIKQFNSRMGEVFGVNEYENLPDLIYNPDSIKNGNKKNHFELTKKINGKIYFAVIKVLKNEIFVQSFRKDSN